VHTLRHSAAVSWPESGVHIKAVADLLGHSSIAVDRLAGRLGL
jgi:site-specific recombinase XerD